MKSNPAMRKLACSLLVAAAALALVPAGAQAQIWNRIHNRMEQAQTVKGKMAPLTIAQEIDVGREVAAKLIGFYHVYQNPEVNRYVNLVGQTVAAQSTRHDITYHFAVLDSNDINAFSAPGGYIFITLGALKLCQDESELAGVLGHEVGHVTAKHVLHVVEREKALRVGMEQASAYTPGSAFLQRMSGAILVKIIDQGLAPADEFQADQLGITYAYKAGYPADGLERFLTRLNQATNQGAHSFWTRTHPPVPQRNARIQQWITSHHWNDDGRPRLAQRYEQAIAVIKSNPQS